MKNVKTIFPLAALMLAMVAAFAFDFTKKSTTATFFYATQNDSCVECFEDIDNPAACTIGKSIACKCEDTGGVEHPAKAGNTNSCVLVFRDPQ